MGKYYKYLQTFNFLIIYLALISSPLQYLTRNQKYNVRSSFSIHKSRWKYY